MELDPLTSLDGTEMVRVRIGNRWRWTTTGAIVTMLGSALIDRAIQAQEADQAAIDAAQNARAASAALAQAARDKAQDDRAAAEDTAEAIRNAAEIARNATQADRDAAQEGRLASLEGRPEEAAHFTATKALPTIAVGAAVTLVLSPLTPAKPGDVLRKGESVSVDPGTALPAGLNIAAALVTADGTVSLQLTASVAIATGAAIVWNITALR